MIGIAAYATATGIGNNAAGNGDKDAGIGDNAMKVITCWTPSWMETGLTRVPGIQFPNESFSSSAIDCLQSMIKVSPILEFSSTLIAGITSK